jgi:hypothetical protein
MRKTVNQTSLDYLNNKPKNIYWKVIAGPSGYKLSVLQDHDLIFDQKDLDIRRLSLKFVEI